MQSCIFYCDDILVFTNSYNEEKHMERLNTVLEKLNSADARLKVSKFQICKKKVKFLGMSLSAEGWNIERKFTKAISKAPRPESRKFLKGFLGLANWQRTFIRNSSQEVYPLQKLLKKEYMHELFTRLWEQVQETAFIRIKNLLVEAKGLLHPDFNKHFYIMTDSSDYTIGHVLFQNGGKGQVKVLGYFSKTLNPTQQKYSIVEKEALGVIRSLEFFRPIIFGLKITVFTDQKALVSLLFKDSPTKYARYREILGAYDVTLKYIEGEKNKSDWLSRFSTGLKIQMEVKEKSAPKDWSEAVFGSESFVINVLKDTDIQQENTVHQDMFYEEAVKSIEEKVPSFKVDNRKYSTADFTFENRILKYLGRTYVRIAVRKTLVENFHNEAKGTARQGI
eukprot:snap_masked-scaffold_26-processed-gene-4.101-mRNA-1 protein AED:0.38 eAED:0.41 QI:0/-1/0/1/-1/1/1/0/392